MLPFSARNRTPVNQMILVSQPRLEFRVYAAFQSRTPPKGGTPNADPCFALGFTWECNKSHRYIEDVRSHLREQRLKTRVKLPEGEEVPAFAGMTKGKMI